MNLIYETSFTVYPEDTNIHLPLIFGGAFFGHLDKAAAVAVRRLLYDSTTCKGAVTHKVENLTFHKPCYMGDLIFIRAEIVSLGVKSVVVDVTAHRENLPQIDQQPAELELAAAAKFVFVTIASDYNIESKPNLLPYASHGLKMPEV